MIFRTARLFALGVALGVAVDRLYLELQKPAADQFPGLRTFTNRSVNPWLMEHGIPGSATAEIATLEHVGRQSGVTYFTPVHPTIHEETLLVPAPLGDGSQWAQNVLHAGHARLQFKEMLYDLDAPVLVPIAATGLFPPRVAEPFDRMGWRYVQFHVAATVPGTFTLHGTSVKDAAPDMPLGGAFDIPVEPRMAEREPATA
jgi:hypothetical protein